MWEARTWSVMEESPNNGLAGECFGRGMMPVQSAFRQALISAAAPEWR